MPSLEKGTRDSESRGDDLLAGDDRFSSEEGAGGEDVESCSDNFLGSDRGGDDSLLNSHDLADRGNFADGEGAEFLEVDRGYGLSESSGEGEASEFTERSSSDLSEGSSDDFLVSNNSEGSSGNLSEGSNNAEGSSGNLSEGSSNYFLVSNNTNLGEGSGSNRGDDLSEGSDGFAGERSDERSSNNSLVSYNSFADNSLSSDGGNIGSGVSGIRSSVGSGVRSGIRSGIWVSVSVDSLSGNSIGVGSVWVSSVHSLSSDNRGSSVHSLSGNWVSVSVSVSAVSVSVSVEGGGTGVAVSLAVERSVIHSLAVQDVSAEGTGHEGR